MEPILNFINTYGASTVVVGAVLYGLYYIITSSINFVKQKQQAKQQIEDQDAEAKRKLEAKRAEQQQYAEIIRQNQQFMTNVMQTVANLEKDLKPQHTVAEQENDRKVNKFIAQNLQSFLDDGADRAYYFTMHNGGKDLIGNGLLKMSITIERINPDVTPIMRRFQNVPRTLFEQLYDSLDENHQYDVDDVEKIRVSDGMTYQFLKEHGVKNAFFRPVKREDGLIVGIVAVEYIDGECRNFEAVQNKISNVSNIITGMVLIDDSVSNTAI